MTAGRPDSDLTHLIKKYQGSITYLKVMVTLIFLVLALELIGKAL